MRITAIYDNQGETLDRYTVLTDWVEKHSDNDPMRDQFMYLGLSEGGRGFSQWGYIDRATHAKLLKPKADGYKALSHLGRLVPFEKLSSETQKHIAEQLLCVASG
jgi:hypothetical protein